MISQRGSSDDVESSWREAMSLDDSTLDSIVARDALSAARGSVYGCRGLLLRGLLLRVPNRVRLRRAFAMPLTRRG